MRKSSSLQLLFAIYFLAAPGISFAASGDLITAFDTDGIVTSNPTVNDEDMIYDMAIDATGIYMTGSDRVPGNEQWRIEKRDLTTGALLTAFDTDGIVTLNPSGTMDVAYDVAVDASGLYVAGGDFSPGNLQWRIEKRGYATGALVTAFDTDGIVTSNPSTGTDGPYDIAVDASGVYIAGYDYAPGNEQWRIEKRNLTSGALLTAFDTDGILTINPSSGLDLPMDMAVTSTGLFIVGTDSSPGNVQWRIEKRDPTTGALINAFGTNGVITINPSSDDDEPSSIIIDSAGGMYPGIYIAGIDWVPGTGDSRWRIEKRDLTTGALDGSFGVDGVVTLNPSSGADDIAAIVQNANSLFIGGSDAAVSNFPQWRVEKRDKFCTYCLDCGLRMYEGVGSYPTRKIMCENPSTSALRVYKNSTNYGVVLTNPTAIDASRFRIQTPSGIKALTRYGDWVSTGAYNGCSPPAGVCTYVTTTSGAANAVLNSVCRVGQTLCHCASSCSAYMGCTYYPYFYECR